LLHAEKAATLFILKRRDEATNSRIDGRKKPAAQGLKLLLKAPRSVIYGKLRRKYLGKMEAVAVHFTSLQVF
jgi:hypothetical protein